MVRKFSECLFFMIIAFSILSMPGAGFVPARGQLVGGTVSTVTNTVGGTVSTVTNTVNNTVSNLTDTGGSTTSTVTNTINQTTSSTLNSTLSSNVTDTSGSVSTGNPLGLPLPSLTIPVSASSSVAGVKAFGNGTLITSINGVSMSFYFDPQGPRGKHSGNTGGTSTDPLIRVLSDDLSGNEITGMYMELQNPNGYDVSARYSPASFTAASGRQYVLYANNYQNFVFNHWDNGSTDPSRPIETSQSITVTAYYSTGGGATPPMSPTGLTATTASSSVINLSWTAPASNGGSAITGYMVERSADGGTSWTTIAGNTGTTATTYADSGLQPNTNYTYRVSAINAVGVSDPSVTASSTTGQALNSTIYKAQSGLVAYDHLTNETMTQQQLTANRVYWNYDGDAPNENAPYGYSRDATGLHIGVQAPSDGTWAGFFAESPNHNAKVWNTLVTNPTRTTHTQYYENGLYVQTANGSLNYITCSTFTNPQATVWGVINATGNYTQVTSYEVLWMDQSPNQPLSRNCNIVTNGSNFLQVFLDGIKVYEKDNANLQMPEPFNAYLEPESSDGEEYLTGSFDNYYVTTDENIKITNLPANAATVDLRNSTGIMESTPVYGGGATLPVAMFNFPLSATIEVYDSSGNLIASNPQSIYGGDVYSLTSSGGSVPQPPTGLEAAGGKAQIALTWSAPTSSGTSPITNYKVYRSTSSGAETLLAQIGNVTSYDDTSVSQGQTYFYKVTAVNSVGESEVSNEASTSATTSIVPPSAPLNLSAQAGNGQILLKWQAPSSTGGSDLAGYRVYRGTASNGEGTTPTGNVGNSTLEFNDTGLTNGQAYFYKVTAVNSAGESQSSNEANATPAQASVPPSPPTGLVATAISSSQINLSWNPPSSNGGSPITGYKIERSADSGVIWSILVSSTGSTVTTYSDMNLSAGTAYAYRVSAINGIGPSQPSNIASATTQSSTPGVPSAPLSLSAVASSYSQINLSWNPPSSNGGSTVTGYEIERSANGGSTWSAIVPDTGSNSTMYSDEGLAAGKSYAYKVSATNSVGTGPVSNTASTTTLATSPSSPTGLTATATSSSTINLAWNAPGWTGGAPVTGYEIQRSADGGSTWSTIVPDTTSSATTYSDTGLASGTTYTYQVFAINSAGSSSHSNVASATTS